MANPTPSPTWWIWTWWSNVSGGFGSHSHSWPMVLDLCRLSYLQIQVLWDLDLADCFISDTLGLLFAVISWTSQSHTNGDLLQHRNYKGRHKYFYLLSIL